MKLGLEILAMVFLPGGLILFAWCFGCEKQKRRQHDEDLLAPYKSYQLMREAAWRDKR